jgi:para-nitrobenzyl esterase
MSEPIVSITDGALQGYAEGGISIFKGIPFAKPPLEELRWQPPVLPEPWAETRDATEFSPIAIQLGTGIEKFSHALIDGQGFNFIKRTLFKLGMKFMSGPTQSEDCLYLNVRTPSIEASSKLPVMVWLHGGDHLDGSGTDALYNNNTLPNLGVVLVTINYRLGLMGYFCHPELSKESPHAVSGNYGTLDQIAALKWVQDNIEPFGGDPSNVTVFGESAGGESVAHMLTSPLTNGLFHRAIIQSGANSSQMYHLNKPALRYKPAEQVGAEFATKLVGEGIQLERLRQLSVDALMDLARSDEQASLFYPVIDGYVLELSPFECFRKGLQHKVPVMVGSNSDEGSLIWPMMDTPLVWRRLLDVGDETIESVIIEEFPGEAAGKLFELYPGLASGDDHAQEELLGDNMFGAKAFFYATTHAQSGESCYLYHFDQVPLSRSQTAGAFHAAEISYVFGVDSLLLPQDEQRASLSRQMSKYWTSFARSGDPNDNELSHWQSFSQNSPEWMQLGSSVGMAEANKADKYGVLNDKLLSQLDSLDD